MTWSPRNRTAEDDDDEDENVGEEDEDDDDLLDASTTTIQPTKRPSSSVSEEAKRLPLHFAQSEPYSQHIFQQLVNQQALFSASTINEEKAIKNKYEPKKIWSIEETLGQAVNKRCEASASCSPLADEIKV